MIWAEQGGAPIILRFLGASGRFRPILRLRRRVWQTTPTPITLATEPGSLLNETCRNNQTASGHLGGCLPFVCSSLGARAGKAVERAANHTRGPGGRRPKQGW